MRLTARYTAAVAALLLGFAAVGPSQAKNILEADPNDRPALAVPIRVVGAQIREVPSDFMWKPAKDEVRRKIKVLDLAVEINSKALNALPPSLQLRLSIGRHSYPVQRGEFSNWDAGKEVPIDKRKPIGVTQTYHFFIKNWQEVEPGQLMILSVVSPQEIYAAVKGEYTEERILRILPEVKGGIPRYAPREFMELRQGQ